MMIAVFAAAVAATVVVCLAVGRLHFTVVTVAGLSMAPTLWHGDRVLVRRRPATRVLRNCVVTTIQPRENAGDEDRRILKRVVAVEGDLVPDDVRPVVDTDVVPPGAVVLRGDGRGSVDSRVVGFYPIDRIEGVVIRRLSVEDSLE
jgi:signal peptidase I